MNRMNRSNVAPAGQAQISNMPTNISAYGGLSPLGYGFGSVQTVVGQNWAQQSQCNALVNAFWYANGMLNKTATNDPWYAARQSDVLKAYDDMAAAGCAGAIARPAFSINALNPYTAFRPVGYPGVIAPSTPVAPGLVGQASFQDWSWQGPKPLYQSYISKAGQVVTPNADGTTTVTTTTTPTGAIVPTPPANVPGATPQVTVVTAPATPTPTPANPVPVRQHYTAGSAIGMFLGIAGAVALGSYVAKVAHDAMRPAR